MFSSVTWNSWIPWALFVRVTCEGKQSIVYWGSIYLDNDLNEE
jgi:hypothetical protein